ncbi:tRNA epoxyqueuosine(34) reductase QueG [Oricola sp.]|uniref:tRNA epoxyqueuosine(34) reductase QueG n=1 Tax=Oricola sp. TaxID=1979950 RepID=UPI0025E77C34|nr:tRNA epoxyqueuosine(34) reductase QueG [Oricola sp.]MCI5077798.1 tRNA epoxyqueuosine(34) reductase QueG [Oricola sp.]
MTNPDKAKAALIADLIAEGFDEARVTRADAIPQAPDRLRAFLDAGHHGTMDWMAETEERRGDPTTLWPQARSVVLAAMNYGPDDGDDPLDALDRRDRATISVYARHRDYHDVIKGKLKQAAGRFAAKTGAQVKVFIDTAPVMEKPLGAAAGLGWQGKHTNLVSRRLGSWFFIGSIFTDMELPPDEPEIDHCGSCRACLDICPTDAFPAPYRLDARRCISYLTIEHAGPIPVAYRRPMGNRIYGCDDCLAVCPWNKFASAASEAKLKARDDLKGPALDDLLTLDDAGFRALFSGSPIKRIGRDRFLRNVLIAAGNSGTAALSERIEPLLGDPDPVVRGAAVWALREVGDAGRFTALRDARLAEEDDETVQEEWTRP